MINEFKLIKGYLLYLTTAFKLWCLKYIWRIIHKRASYYTRAIHHRYADYQAMLSYKQYKERQVYIDIAKDIARKRKLFNHLDYIKKRSQYGENKQLTLNIISETLYPTK